LLKRTREIFRKAEFGFLGVIVRTCKQTPCFWGHFSSTGDLLWLFLSLRRFRTSWLIVGIENGVGVGISARLGNLGHPREGTDCRNSAQKEANSRISWGQTAKYRRPEIPVKSFVGPATADTEREAVGVNWLAGARKAVSGLALRLGGEGSYDRKDDPCMTQKPGWWQDAPVLSDAPS
jgi:hypothetical protein